MIRREQEALDQHAANLKAIADQMRVTAEQLKRGTDGRVTRAKSSGGVE